VHFALIPSPVLVGWSQDDKFRDTLLPRFNKLGEGFFQGRLEILG